MFEFFLPVLVDFAVLALSLACLAGIGIWGLIELARPRTIVVPLLLGLTPIAIPLIASSFDSLAGELVSVGWVGSMLGLLVSSMAFAWFAAGHGIGSFVSGKGARLRPATTTIAVVAVGLALVATTVFGQGYFLLAPLPLIAVVTAGPANLRVAWMIAASLGLLLVHTVVACLLIPIAFPPHTWADTMILGVILFAVAAQVMFVFGSFAATAITSLAESRLAPA